MIGAFLSFTAIAVIMLIQFLFSLAVFVIFLVFKRRQDEERYMPSIDQERAERLDAQVNQVIKRAIQDLSGNGYSHEVYTSKEISDIIERNYGDN
jgi:uncharacterized membrane protein